MEFRLTLLNDYGNIPLYIRFGNVPESEKSFIRYRNYECGYEPGVSVYDCIIKNGQINICLPYPWGEGTFHTFWDFMERFQNRKIYLVTGTEIGRGTDNEPLIINVRVLSEITNDWLDDLKDFSDVRHESLLKRAEENGWKHN